MPSTYFHSLHTLSLSPLGRRENQLRNYSFDGCCVIFCCVRYGVAFLCGNASAARVCIGMPKRSLQMYRFLAGTPFFWLNITVLWAGYPFLAQCYRFLAGVPILGSIVPFLGGMPLLGAILPFFGQGYHFLGSVRSARLSSPQVSNLQRLHINSQQYDTFYFYSTYDTHVVYLFQGTITIAHTIVGRVFA